MSNFRIPYLIGDSRPRDVVSWPLKNKADAITYFGGAIPFTRAYPIGVTAAAIRFWASRVKSWTLAGRFQSSCLGQSIDTGNITQATPLAKSLAVGIDIETYPDPATNEKQIIGPPIDGDPDLVTKKSLIRGLRNWGAYADDVNPVPPTYLFFPGPFESDPRNPATIVRSVMFDIPTENGAFPYVVFDPDTELFYPSFDVQISASFTVTTTFLGGMTPENYFILASSHFASPPDLTLFAGHIAIDTDLDGGTINLPLKISAFKNGGTFSSSTSEAGTCNFTLKPNEFWPYKTKSGLPVYDTATGVQLNSPFA